MKREGKKETEEGTTEGEEVFGVRPFHIITRALFIDRHSLYTTGNDFVSLFLFFLQRTPLFYSSFDFMMWQFLNSIYF